MPKLDSWTNEEIEILIDNKDLTRGELLKILPRKKSLATLTSKMIKLGFRKRKNPERWTKQEIEILKNNTHLTNKELKEQFFPQREIRGIKHKVCELKIKKTHSQARKYTKEEIDFVKENYHKIPTVDIAKKINTKLNLVMIIAYRYGLTSNIRILLPTNKAQSIKCNESYFKVPNLVNCYWAGFLAADGNISDFDKKKRLSLQISDKDYEHCKKFADELNFSGKISRYTRKNGVKMCNFSINSNKLCHDLEENFNIVPRKTLKLQPPNIIDQEMIYSYIVGYLCGDGWISKRKKYQNLFTFGFIGQKTFLDWVRKQLSKLIIDETTKQKFLDIKTKDFPNYSKISFANKTYTNDILLFLKTLKVPKLERKWNKLESFKSEVM